MKRKIFSIFVALTMIFGAALPAFAADVDPDVQAFYDAHQAMNDALESRSFSEIASAFMAFSEASGSMYDFTDEQTEQLLGLYGMTEDELGELLLADIMIASSVYGMGTMIGEFQAEPTAESALMLIDSYNYICDENSEFYDADMAQLMTEVFPEIGQICEDAKEYLPDDEVMAVYYAYNAIINGLFSGDTTSLDAHLVGVGDVINNAMANFTEEQTADLAEILYTEPDTVFSEILGEYFTAQSVLQFGEAYYSFSADPNALTALEFVVSYDYAFNDPDYADENLQFYLSSFFYDLEEVYADAQTYIPDEDVLALYEAYANLTEIYSFASVDMLPEAIDGYADLVNNALENFTEEQIADLASLMGVDVENVAGALIGDYINANIIIEVADLYNAFFDEESSENAQAFIEKYDSIFNDPDYVDEALREDVREFFPDIDDVYEYASSLKEVPVDTEDPADTETDADVETETDVETDADIADTESDVAETDEVPAKPETPESPKTGDSVLWVVFALAICGAAAVVACKKRSY